MPTMFFLILALLPLVALSISNPHVTRTEIAALQNDLNNMVPTVATIQARCEDFKGQVNYQNAAALVAAVQALDLQVQQATMDCPNDQVSDDDGQAICTSITALIPLLNSTMLCIDDCKNDFSSIFARVVCVIVKNLNADNIVLFNHLLAASPGSAKPCTQKSIDEIVVMAEETLKDYC
ncbi:hypothetical protein EDD85DRAFT_432691 [Armillaria nabsnona]|nr:hypothetical protein EDD85DRAFT_432691 [Armillaria nabsnona]